MQKMTVSKVKNYLGGMGYAVLSTISAYKQKKAVEKRSKELNKIILRYKFVHIIFNDKFCDPFIRFNNANFGMEQHAFLVYKMYDRFPITQAENVYEFQSLWGLDFSDSRIERIIMHSLFVPDCVKYWNEHQIIQQKKVFWMMWGGDLYDAPRNELEDTVRKNFKGYISCTDGDCEVVRKKYQLCDKVYIDGEYSYPITVDMINAAIRERKEHDYIQIQVNNSADETTIDMLKKLARFANQDVRIVTVLSYGHMQYKDEIIQTGESIFGDKFEYLTNYLPPSEYTKWLANNDVFILNQDRQEGSNNAEVVLAEGAKLYIKSSVTTYHHFNDKGIKVYDTWEIEKISFEDLIAYDSKERQHNMETVGFFFDDAYLKTKWEPVYNL